MLIQMPRGSSDRPGAKDGSGKDAFEAALRRDLASAPVVAYNAILGGWTKRAFDLAITLITIPLWVPALAGAAVLARLRHRAPVFVADERIGYGGRAFNCFRLQLNAPAPNVEPLFSASDEPQTSETAWSQIEQQAEGRRAKWRRALECLPQFLNVLWGDMALVGPTPLPREAVGELKAAKRYYLSCRPGLVGIEAVREGDVSDAPAEKLYALCWSLTTDAIILCEGIRSLRDRGELWNPPKVAKGAGEEGEARPVVVRQRAVGD